jgi:uncharacterized lipoprotein YehR (DUF1307 family)
MEKLNFRISYQLQSKKHSEYASDTLSSLEEFFKDLDGVKQEYSYNIRIGSIFTHNNSKFKVVDIKSFFSPKCAFTNENIPSLDLQIIVEIV